MSRVAKQCAQTLFSPEQMLLPLFSEIIQKIEVKAVIKEAVKASRVGRPVKVEVDESEVAQWDDIHIERLHLYLLDESFSVAGTPRTSPDVRDEIISWVLEKSRPGAMPAPCSFEACCVFAGYDAEELRALFISEMSLRGYMTA